MDPKQDKAGSKISLAALLVNLWLVCWLALKVLGHARPLHLLVDALDLDHSLHLLNHLHQHQPLLQVLRELQLHCQWCPYQVYLQRLATNLPCRLRRLQGLWHQDVLQMNLSQMQFAHVYTATLNQLQVLQLTPGL